MGMLLQRRKKRNRQALPIRQGVEGIAGIDDSNNVGSAGIDDSDNAGPNGPNAIDTLKAKATELGIAFHPNISYDKLAERVQDHIK